MDDVRWLNEREERAWRALQYMQMRLEAELARQLSATPVCPIPTISCSSRSPTVPLGGCACSSSPTSAVRRLFVDQLTPSQLDAIGDAAEAVLAAFEEKP